MNQRQLIEVDPQRIKFNPLNPRKHRGTEYIRLKESIKKIGIVQLPTVRILAGGFYEVIDGEGRVSIAQEEKFPKIWVVSVGFVSDEEAMVMLQSANTTRSFNLLAECKGLANMHRQGKTNAELAKQFGKSESKIQTMVAIGYFPPQLLGKIEEDIAKNEKQAEIWGYLILDNILPLRELSPNTSPINGGTLGKYVDAFNAGKNPSEIIKTLDGLYDYTEVEKAINRVIDGKVTTTEQMRTYVVNRKSEIFQARFDQDLQKKLQDELAKTREDLEALKARQIKEVEEKTQLRYEGQITTLETQLKDLEGQHKQIVNDVAKRPEIVEKREKELKEKIREKELERLKLEADRKIWEAEAQEREKRIQEKLREEQERIASEMRQKLKEELIKQSEEQERQLKEAEDNLKDLYAQKDQQRQFKAENTIRGLLSHGIKSLAETQQTIEHIISDGMFQAVQQLGGTQQNSLLAQIQSLRETLDRAEAKLTQGDYLALTERIGVNGYKE